MSFHNENKMFFIAKRPWQMTLKVFLSMYIFDVEILPYMYDISVGNIAFDAMYVIWNLICLIQTKVMNS